MSWDGAIVEGFRRELRDNVVAHLKHVARIRDEIGLLGVASKGARLRQLRQEAT